MWADLAGYSKMRSTTAACGVPVVLGELWSDIPARQTSSASVTSGGLPGPDRRRQRVRALAFLYAGGRGRRPGRY